MAAVKNYEKENKATLGTLIKAVYGAHLYAYIFCTS